MRTVQTNVSPADPFGKDNHVAIVNLGDEGDPLDLHEVLGASQGYAHAVP